MDEPMVLIGAEPFFNEGSRTGILVSHGFTGSPQSMRFLAEGFAAAGFSVALPRLKGHGTSTADMATSTAGDWVADLNKAAGWLKERCDAIFMTGLSMGGTLTLLLAGQYPDLFKGILPINAAILINNPLMASLVFMTPALAEVPGVGGDIKAEGVRELAYETIPVPTIKELLLLAKVTDELLPRITCPTLYFVSRDDHIVPPANAEYVLQRIASQEKRQLWLENSYHVATLDNDKALILQESLNFIKSHIS
jgi:carboxylesterase